MHAFILSKLHPNLCENFKLVDHQKALKMTHTTSKRKLEYISPSPTSI
jgi:hypothetical protein